MQPSVSAGRAAIRAASSSSAAVIVSKGGGCPACAIIQQQERWQTILSSSSGTGSPTRLRRRLHSSSSSPSSRALHTPAAARSSAAPSGSTVNPDEISHFSSLAAEWWNEGGGFGVLQRMNRVRVQFLRERLLEAAMYEQSGGRERGVTREQIEGPRMLEGLRVLDVGCGGGLFAERLARLGGETLAVDASYENVETAKLHASQDPHLDALMQQGLLEYRNCAAEDLLVQQPDTASDTTRTAAAHDEQFDIVCAMEVLEHVSDPPAFLRSLARLTKPGGHIIMSTISRTPLAKFLAIDFAESALVRFAPAGSHTYEKFVKPDELVGFFRSELGWGASNAQSTSAAAAASPNNHLAPSLMSLRHDIEVRGTTYLPWKGEWELFAKDQPNSLRAQLAKSCNYFFGARKPL